MEWHISVNQAIKTHSDDLLLSKKLVLESLHVATLELYKTHIVVMHQSEKPVMYYSSGSNVHYIGISQDYADVDGDDVRWKMILTAPPEKLVVMCKGHRYIARDAYPPLERPLSLKDCIVGKVPTIEPSSRIAAFDYYTPSKAGNANAEIVAAGVGIGQ
jgi:hypothetical protein